MIVAIHQPNYMPWLGYFYKIHACDVFVLHDSVEFSASSYTKRCKIRKAKGSGETTWLSIPVIHPDQGALIRDISIERGSDWTSKHLRKIQNTYASAPFFEAHFEWLGQLMKECDSIDLLAETNEILIKEFSVRLGIQARFIRSSQLNVDGKGGLLNLAIAKKLGATQYLAGTGSTSYEEEILYQQAGIKKITHDLGAWLNEHPYDQGTGSFTPGLSVLDALFHVGVEGIQMKFEQFHHCLLS